MTQQIPPKAVVGAVRSLLGTRGFMTVKAIKQELEMFANPDLVDDAIELLAHHNEITRNDLPGMQVPVWKLNVVDASAPRTQWFAYRHIVPLVYGMPEWIVERLEDNKLYAWCPDERLASRIAEALNAN